MWIIPIKNLLFQMFVKLNGLIVPDLVRADRIN